MNADFITDYDEEIKILQTFHDEYHHMILLTIGPEIDEF